MSQTLIDRIMARCVEDAGCLIWPGAMAAGTNPQIRHEDKLVNIRRFLYEREKGPIPEGKQIGVLCECKRCIRHIGPLTVQEVRQKVARTGAYATAIHGPKIAAGWRARRKYSAEFIAEVRESDEPTMDMARRLGVSFSHLYKIRRGETRKYDQPNPFASLIR